MTEEEEVEVENCHMLITSLLNEGSVIKIMQPETTKSKTMVVAPLSRGA
jgi:hypothetical protein